mgnify:CR=1 FL=1
MNVIVCVKQIPDPATPGALDPGSNTLKRDGKLILDESDSYGVEMALQLVDAAGGGEVSLVSMAPNGEVSGMRTALAMGADRGILVKTDETVEPLAVAKILAKIAADEINANGWMVTLLNPAGQDKPQQGITPTDYRENRQVTIRARVPISSAIDRLQPTDRMTISPAANGIVNVTCEVLAGGVRIVEIK